MNALDKLVSLSVASYAAAPAPEPGTVLIRNRQVVKIGSKPVKAAKAPKAAAPIAQPASPPKAEINLKAAGPVLPKAGTIDAKGFFKMMRSASSRENQMTAVAAYIGYDFAKDLGSQVFNATQRAKSEICPIDPNKVVSRAEKAQLSATVKGYVSGLPDGTRKLVQDLAGRERLAVDTRKDLVTASQQSECTPEQRETLLAQALLEEERLVQIRADLARYL
jgi:hypothetical protein